MADPMAVSSWKTGVELGSRGVYGFAVADHGQAQFVVARQHKLAQGGQVDPQIIGVEVKVAADVLKRGAVFRRALGRFAQQKLAVGALGQMAAFFVHLGAVGYFHEEGDVVFYHVTQNAQVNDCAQVVGVGDKGVFHALGKKRAQRSTSDQGGVDVAVAGRTPFQVWFLRPDGRRQIGLDDFGLFVLQKT